MLERASAANATKDVVTWVLPAVKGLQALISADALTLNAAVEELIKTHALHAQKDDFFSKSPNGFLCMPGLMLAKLGSEKKLACTVKSDYLPLQLIGGVKMSGRFELYIVDSEALPTELPDVYDLQKYRTLVEAVQSVGTKWGTVSLSERDFAEGLERIDKQIEGNGFLPVLSFNNSPGNLLGDYGDCPCFGYFTPEMVEVILEGIKLIDPVAIDQIQNEPSTKVVLDVYESVAAKAVRRGYAIAIIHA
ncbi:immunity 49 family protein [bacterium]|nr:immunity 49 family protein [bacterium]